MSKHKNLAPETVSAQALGMHDAATAGVVPGIHPASTFLRDENYALAVAGNSYSRDENPTHRVAEAVLSELEGGADAMLFSSGMAAATAVVQTLNPGDRIVAPRVMYWGLRNWLLDFCDQWGVELHLFESTDEAALASAASNGNTKLVWIETPCNPTWDVIDIAAAAEVAHGVGAKLVVDSTVATPVLTQPISLGADIVMHSATKYLNGHSDIVAGALVTAANDDTWEKIRAKRIHAGAVLGSLEAWLLQRGMRTLFLRVREASSSALRIAQHFEGHQNVSAVRYPGLESHPGHEVSKRQMSGGFGGMLSIQVRGGKDAALGVAKRCRVFARATSLGGVESLIEHRYSIEGKGSPIPEDLLRLSVGIENVDDLIADLEQALT